MMLTFTRTPASCCMGYASGTPGEGGQSTVPQRRGAEPQRRAGGPPPPARLGTPPALIPPALVPARSGPLAAGDRGEPVGRRHEPVPGLAAGRDDRVVVGPDPQAELVLAQVLPDVLDRVQLGRVGG